MNSSLFYGHAGCLQLRVSKETWEPEFSLGQLYNKGLFLLGYAPEVIHFTTRLLENQRPDRGTLEDALELLRIYEAYLLPDQTLHRIPE